MYITCYDVADGQMFSQRHAAMVEADLITQRPYPASLYPHPHPQPLPLSLHTAVNSMNCVTLECGLYQHWHLSTK